MINSLPCFSSATRQKFRMNNYLKYIWLYTHTHKCCFHRWIVSIYLSIYPSIYPSICLSYNWCKGGKFPLLPPHPSTLTSFSHFCTIETHPVCLHHLFSPLWTSKQKNRSLDTGSERERADSAVQLLWMSQWFIGAFSALGTGQHWSVCV